MAETIVLEQMWALTNSGLEAAAQEVYVGLNGDEGDAWTLCQLLCDKAQIHVHGKSARSELPTFSRMRSWLPEHREWAVFYHHSKGVTQPQDEFHHHHRRTMEAALVHQWRRCVADLERGFEAVGINLVDPKKRPVLPGRFFAGNFWWARADYLLQLPPLPDTLVSWNDPNRCLAEGWIGTCSREPRMMDYERPNLYL